MTYTLVFVTSWISFILFADKKRFRELHVTCLVAMVMSLGSDVITNCYPLWLYNDPDTHFPNIAIELLDDLGLYPVLAYIYIQHVPKGIKKWPVYTFFWTIGGCVIEFILTEKGYLKYHHGWNLICSCAADWVIFAILSIHHLAASQRTKPLDLNFGIRQFLESLRFETDLMPAEKIFVPEITRRNSDARISHKTLINTVEYFFTVINPGIELPFREHLGYEFHYIIDGTVTVTVNGKERFLNKGEIFHFSALESHGFKNHGATPVQIITLIFGSLGNLKSRQSVQAH